MNLTQAFVRRAKCDKDKEKQFFYDDDLKGFMLEVRANGRKTYFLKTTTNDGNRKSTKIGDATILPAEEARTKALKLKRNIEEGKDVMIATPSDTSNKGLTLGEFYSEYYLPFIQKHIKSWKSNDSMMRTHILPLFKNHKMGEIKKHEIMKAHIEMLHKKKRKPATANKLLIFLHGAFTIALDMELEGIKENPVANIKLLEENNARERYLTKRESKRLLEAIKQSKNPNLPFVVPFLILTGARRGEVLKAKWEDFNLEQKRWTIPITKNGKKRVLPLTEQLIALIKEIPKKSNIYLFPSPVTGLPQNDLFKSWDYARTKANLKDLRMHDLRHSFASVLVNSGRSLYEVQTLLGHSSLKMTQRYAHLSNESLMAAASCAGKLLE